MVWTVRQVRAEGSRIDGTLGSLAVGMCQALPGAALALAGATARARAGRRPARGKWIGHRVMAF